MTEEIKRIIEELKHNIPIEEYRSEGTSDGLTHYEADKYSWQYKLLDYIIDLQEENEKLKYNARGQVNDYFKDKYADEVLKTAELQRENETLKAKLEIGKTCGFCPYYDYKSRCKKAIEYIKSTYFYGMRSGKTLIQKYLCDLLNILNGSGESETNSIIYSDEDVKQENSVESAIGKIWDKKLVDEYFEQLKVLKELKDSDEE